jgi:hypothetical protein
MDCEHHHSTPAERALARALLARGMRRAILRDAAAWQTLYDELRGQFTRAWTEELQTAVAAALDTLRDIPPDRFTAADGRLLLAAMEQRVGGPAVAAALRQPVLNLTDALMQLGTQEVAQAAGIDLAFMRPDPAAIDLAQRANLYWVGEHWDAHTHDAISRVLSDYYGTGLTREQLARQLAEALSGLGDRSAYYWDLLADHTATRTREMGRVDGYERAGIEYVEVRAQIDDRTSDVCRRMHGRLIPVSRLRTQRDAYLTAAAAGDRDAAKRAWTMHGSRDIDIPADPDAPLPAGTAGPPYHLRCRTITVLYTGAAP